MPKNKNNKPKLTNRQRIQNIIHKVIIADTNNNTYSKLFVETTRNRKNTNPTYKLDMSQPNTTLRQIKNAINSNVLSVGEARTLFKNEANLQIQNKKRIEQKLKTNLAPEVRYQLEKSLDNVKDVINSYSRIDNILKTGAITDIKDDLRNIAKSPKTTTDTRKITKDINKFLGDMITHSSFNLNEKDLNRLDRLFSELGVDGFKSALYSAIDKNQKYSPSDQVIDDVITDFLTRATEQAYRPKKNGSVIPNATTIIKEIETIIGTSNKVEFNPFGDWFNN